MSNEDKRLRNGADEERAWRSRLHSLFSTLLHPSDKLLDDLCAYSFAWLSFGLFFSRLLNTSVWEYVAVSFIPGVILYGAATNILKKRGFDDILSVTAKTWLIKLGYETAVHPVSHPKKHKKP